MGSDSGFIAVGWLTKLALTLGLLGLLSFDGASLVSANFSAANRATTYANDAADSFHNTKNIDVTYAFIVSEAKAKGDTVDAKTFSIGPNGQAHVTLHHTAHTLWMKSVGFLKTYTVVTESGTGTGSP